jgi:hypothetical protein
MFSLTALKNLVFIGDGMPSIFGKHKGAKLPEYEICCGVPQKQLVYIVESILNIGLIEVKYDHKKYSIPRIARTECRKKLQRKTANVLQKSDIFAI